MVDWKPVSTTADTNTPSTSTFKSIASRLSCTMLEHPLVFCKLASLVTVHLRSESSAVVTSALGFGDSALPTATDSGYMPKPMASITLYVAVAPNLVRLVT